MLLHKHIFKWKSIAVSIYNYYLETDQSIWNHFDVLVIFKGQGVFDKKYLLENWCTAFVGIWIVSIWNLGVWLVLNCHKINKDVPNIDHLMIT